MPHFRQRHLEPLLKKTFKYSSITGIFGHRQVGKTTLAEKLGSTYCTLDTIASFEAASRDPESFLNANVGQPTVIDECQLAPPLFPALKEWVRVRKAPGQFLLTGSVRFSSRKAIRESLTGRIVSWELLPMDLSEAHSAQLPDSIPALLEAKTVEVSLKKSSYFQANTMNLALSQGGLPGIFSIRNHAVRAQRFETQLNTILERDLKLVYQSPLSYPTLRNLAVQLSLLQGKPLEWQSLSRQTRISVPTLKKLLYALESIYFLRLVPTEGTEKKPVLFLEDQGEASFLCSGRYDDFTNLLRFLYSQLRVQIHYRPELAIRIFQLRNRGGAYVPLCFAQGKKVLGIIPLLSDNPEPSHLTIARFFNKKFPDSKLLFVHTGNEDKILSPSVRSLPISKLL